MRRLQSTLAPGAIIVSLGSMTFGCTLVSGVDDLSFQTTSTGTGGTGGSGGSGGSGGGAGDGGGTPGPACDDAVKNGSETDVDCGGSCPLDCADGKTCGVGGDCQSGVCTSGVCAVPTCTDAVKNGAESDVDCGGNCAKCALGDTCGTDADCADGRCFAGTCVTPCIDVTLDHVGSTQTYSPQYAGTYRIEAAGAQGGADSYGNAGGLGAKMRGDFPLALADILQIVVGGRATNAGQYNGGGGGGGTFVYKSLTELPLPALPMIVAGGGAGGPGTGGGTGNSGASGAAPGGTNGNGGSSDLTDFIYSGGGGVGWLADGATGSTPINAGGGHQWAGGMGGTYGGNPYVSGGFGGGGAAGMFQSASGGGGGYSGGGAGAQTKPPGGGGGSFNAGAAQMNTAATRAGHGYVLIHGPLAPGCM